ncbi:MAG TPA: F0F1 ATP synthase subunit B' [Stellaceae bacterium]|jgi:F-type H+-transporting ATPase subunit b|nr:F0F1 ATP synthase subunit B' [Stellaceae bacterium]
MPQLDLATFPTQLIWLAITFIVLYLVMRAVGLPRVGDVIAARRARIDGDLEKAQQLKNETEAVIAAYEKALAEARAQAQVSLRETTEQLNAQSAERQRKVVEELAKETAAAERRINEAKQQALGSLRDIAIEATREAAQKLTGAALDGTRAASAVDGAMRERG